MRYLVLLALVAIGCSNGTGPTTRGPLKIGIVAGNNQRSVAAPEAQLAAPVVGQLVRLSDGTVSWRQRTSDALLPARAWAQTDVLKGSPVIGAVVCAASIGSGLEALTPVVPCAQTDKNGQVTFAFKHGTLAGTRKAVVQGMEGSVVATYDTATAIVTPAPAEPNMAGWLLGWVVSPAKFPYSGVHDKYMNPIPYRIPADGRLTPRDTVLGSDGARTVTFGVAQADNVFHVIGLTGEGGVVVANMRYRVFLNDGVPQIDWTACGLSVSPCVGTIGR